jgi:hypothetical protein
MKNIFAVLTCVYFLLSSSTEGIYGTYFYYYQDPYNKVTVITLAGSAISILEDGTYQFVYRFIDFGPRYYSEGVWEYIRDDKYLIKTLYDHNSIPMDVIEKSTGADSLRFVFTGGVGMYPTEELHIDSAIYYFKPKQDTLKISKSSVKDSSVFYIRSEVDPETIGPGVNHSWIKSIDYRINNPEADLFEISFPARTPFKYFFDYHYLEELNDTIEIRNGELIFEGAVHPVAPGRSLPDW